MLKFLRNSLFPLFLILVCPMTVMIVWQLNTDLHGSLLAYWQYIKTTNFFTALYYFWQPVLFGTAMAWKIIACFGLVQLILMRVVPGKRFEGPLTPKGNTPIYKANGFSCYLITMVLFFVGSYGLGWFSATIIYDNFLGILGALNVFSLLFCLLLYIKGRYFPSTTDKGVTGNFIFDYYWGTELYPRILGWDIKLFTNCRFGMMSWPLIIISFAAKQTQVYGLSNSMLICVLIMLVYITKFFWWETGYLRSLDIMHDRAGFYICWGCLVWVPAIYTLPAMYLVNHPYHFSWLAGAFILAAGVISVMLNYFADRQRQMVRATNGECKIWGKKPEIIKAQYVTKEGETKNSILLVSGWWGVSRHFHYLPEILSAFFWTLPVLFLNFLPWFYVIFLTILLFHRSIRDEARCREKYGLYWQQYCERVPGRIFPRFKLSSLVDKTETS